MYYGVKVDWFLVQLMTSEHTPMPVDNLGGLNALTLDVGKDLTHRVGRPTIGEHHPTCLGVMDHRAEGLTELMGNRARQRPQRLRRLASAASARFLRLRSRLFGVRGAVQEPTIRSDCTASTPTALSTVPVYARHRLGAR